MTIREPARDIQVLGEADVLVAGGGVSGAAAALAAARAGARTVLVERNGVLGGVATAGLMANISNHFLDRQGRLVIGGIAKEVVDRLTERGAASAKWASREVPGIVIDSEQLKPLLGAMLTEAGVSILTHCLAARPIMDGQAVRGAFIESKIGRQAILARIVVDATGEADLAAQTGCPMRWSEGSASVEFKMANVDLEALYLHFRRHPDTFPVGLDMVKGFAEFERNWVERGIFFFPHGGGRKWDLVRRAVAEGRFEESRGILYDLHAFGLYGLRGQDTVVVNSNFWKVDTLDTVQVSRAELEAQASCYYLAGFLTENVPGFPDAHVVAIGSDIGIRVSRGIAGRETLTGDAVASPRPVLHDDVIGCVPCRADVQSGGEFFYAHTCDVPYGILLPQTIENLLVASGKSVSCTPQGLLRGMASCMLIGQAAGVAAALSAQRYTTPHSLDVLLLQRALQDQGTYLGSSYRLMFLGQPESDSREGRADPSGEQPIGPWAPARSRLARPTDLARRARSNPDAWEGDCVIWERSCVSLTRTCTSGRTTRNTLGRLRLRVHPGSTPRPRCSLH